MRNGLGNCVNVFMNWCDEAMILSIQKAICILDTVADNGNISLRELSRQVGMPKSTVCKIAQTLEACGYLYQEPGSGEYYVSYRLFRVGCEFLEKLGVRECAFPILKRLAKESQETVSLTVMDDNKVLYLEKLESSRFSTGFKVGGRAPLHCTSSGKAMLASLPPRRLEEVLSEITPLEAFTENTNTDVDLLRKKLKKVREQGYALFKGEINLGIASIATSIKDYPGREAAAISITGPSISSNPDTSADLIKMLLKASEEISANFKRAVRSSIG